MREIELLRRQLAEAQAEARVARRERANLEARLTAQKQTEAALRDSEERLHMALEAGRMGAWRLDLKTGVQQWSPTQYGLFGLNPNTTSPSRDLFLSLVLPEDRPIVEYAPEDLLPRRGFLDSEFRIRRPDGEVRWLVARTTVRRDKHGEPLEMVGLNWDITDRKLTEEELRKGEERLQFLVEELQHRTRNLMGVVMAMSDMTAHASSTLDDFRTSFGERLRALARVQGLSSRSPAGGRVAFDELLNSELTAHSGRPPDGERIALEGPRDVALPLVSVQPLAMALHELTTNALKYGALKPGNGRLHVRWTVEAGPCDPCPWIVVDWKERGVDAEGSAAERNRFGNGRRLIEEALPYQFGARTSFEIEGDGVHCTIALPISGLRSEEIQDGRLGRS